MMTLLPGDVIATGTPSGVSKLSSGDVCEVEIEGIGVLTSPVTKEERTTPSSEAAATPPQTRRGAKNVTLL